jgi:hypothetical protein
MNHAETFGQLLSAWRQHAEHEPVWDGYGLHVLAAADLLNTEPLYLAGAVPSRDDVIALTEALGARLDHVAADPNRSVALRLAHDAAASELRHGITALR